MLKINNNSAILTFARLNIINLQCVMYYSYLNASMGSSLDALRAELKPKNTPTEPAKKKARAIEPIKTNL
jgi:hypothetical protein